MSSAPVYTIIRSDGQSSGGPTINWDKIWAEMVERNSPEDFGAKWRPKTAVPR